MVVASVADGQSPSSYLLGWRVRHMSEHGNFCTAAGESCNCPGSFSAFNSNPPNGVHPLVCLHSLSIWINRKQPPTIIIIIMIILNELPQLGGVSSSSRLPRHPLIGEHHVTPSLVDLTEHNNNNHYTVVACNNVNNNNITQFLGGRLIFA